MKVWPCWGWGLCFYERIAVPTPAWIQMLFNHEEPTALPRQICHVQGIGLDVRGDQVEGFGRLLREEIRPLVPLYIMSRSYAMEPECEPCDTLFEFWKDRFVFKPSTDHNVINLHMLSVIVVCIYMDL